ncbi:MAG: hypothetical protein F6K39_15415 [Okeania sp. SIO3B3]|nr:hypothetical protein [Okeania sp. SIO3B3]
MRAKNQKLTLSNTFYLNRHLQKREKREYGEITDNFCTIIDFIFEFWRCLINKLVKNSGIGLFYINRSIFLEIMEANIPP